MQGYRPERSGILTNPVGGKMLLTRVIRGKPIQSAEVTLRKPMENGLSPQGFCTHL